MRRLLPLIWRAKADKIFLKYSVLVPRIWQLHILSDNKLTDSPDFKGNLWHCRRYLIYSMLNNSKQVTAKDSES